MKTHAPCPLLRFLRVAAGIAVLLACAGVPASGAEPESRDRRRVDPARTVDLPFAHIRLRSDLRLTEGPRSLSDVFPYLVVSEKTASSATGYMLTSKNLGPFLFQEPQEGGTVPAAVRTAEGAIEATRLFVAGPLVRTRDTAERIIAVGRELEGDSEHLSVKVTDHRPKHWEATATPLPQDKSIHPTEAWAVSLVAMEMDRTLRLVHVEAVVRARGEVDITRKPIVDGPMTSWQTASLGKPTEADLRSEREMHAEAERARARYAKALHARRDLDTVWVVGRVVPDFERVKALLGEPDRDVGSGIHIQAYDLSGGTVGLFGETGGPLLYVLQAASAKGPMQKSEILRALYRGR